MTNQTAIKSDDVETLVRERGREDGDAVGSYVIDGSTSKELAREIFQGIEDGDPAILDMLPELQLGQWADDPSFEEILEDLGIEYSEDEVDDLFNAYSDAWSEGMIDRVTQDARNAMPLAIKLTTSDDDDGTVTIWCDDADRAMHDQSVNGCRWERAESGAYAITLDRPNLVEELQSEGYGVDDSEYSAPDDEDIAYWTYKNDALNAGEDPLDREDWLALDYCTRCGSSKPVCESLGCVEGRKQR